MRRSLVPFIAELEDMKSIFDQMDENCASLCKSTASSSVSVYEDEDKIYVEAAVPGIKPEEIQITFEKGVLWIKAESKEEKKDVKFHTKAVSNFSYRVPISNRVDEGSSPDAVCKNGVVKITFHKSKAAKVHRIEVKAQ